jgi:hypothetical protein
LLQAHDKRTYLTSFLRVLSTSHLSTTYDEADETWHKDDAPIVAAAAALLGKLISDDDDFKDVLQEWITSSSGGGVGESLSLRRAVMTVVKEDELLFRQVTEKLLAQFADKMWIARTMIVRQEGMFFYFSVLNFVAPSCWMDLAAADSPGHKGSRMSRGVPDLRLTLPLPSTSTVFTICLALLHSFLLSIPQHLSSFLGIVLFAISHPTTPICVSMSQLPIS